MLNTSWSKEKSVLLKKTRGVNFEQIIEAVDNNQVIVVLPHSNPKKYRNQKIMVINISNYAFCVPFVTEGNKRFLKTIYPSSKYTKKYIKEAK